MAQDTFNPHDAEAHLGRMLGTAAAARRDMLEDFARDSRQAAESLRRVRDELATLDPGDPRVQALDRRAAGAEQVATFTTRTLEEIHKSAKTGDWVVAGRVLDEEGKPVAKARVTLSGDDRLEKRFGDITTGADGKFEVRFPGAEFAAVFARAPKVKLLARSPGGKLHATTHDIVPVADGINVLDVRLGEAEKAAPKSPPVRQATATSASDTASSPTAAALPAKPRATQPQKGKKKTKPPSRSGKKPT
ncbi:MAG TPA: carboxypeptidase-like regulatory domain-containing protein [Thermoanaerobaculia bacterium]|nr:carboxypeptidase-like regulatory domain-containing protein [Thermoanaerobaculia bacterium]